jgi:hypothetical protein
MGLVNSVSKFPPEFQQQIVQVVSQIVEQMKGQFATTEAEGKMPQLPGQEQPQQPPGSPGLNQGNYGEFMNNGRQ